MIAITADVILQGGSHLSCTAVKPDSHLAWIFAKIIFSFSLYNLTLISQITDKPGEIFMLPKNPA